MSKAIYNYLHLLLLSFRDLAVLMQLDHFERNPNFSLCTLGTNHLEMIWVRILEQGEYPKKWPWLYLSLSTGRAVMAIYLLQQTVAYYTANKIARVEDLTPTAIYWILFFLSFNPLIQLVHDRSFFHRFSPLLPLND